MKLTLNSISTTGGYLENAPIVFANGLTCIIGARGTCKSTIVETIRFLFDADINRIKELVRPTKEESPGHVHPYSGLLHETLGASIARCEIFRDGKEGGEQLTLERDTESPEPRIYRNGVKELSDKSVLNHIEIYSQGDLQDIAADGSRRLELVDRPNRIEILSLKSNLNAASASLLETGNRIRALRAGIDSRRGELKALDGFRLQLSTSEQSMPKPSSELEQEREDFSKRKATLDAASEAIDSRAKTLNDLRSALLAMDDYSDAVKRLSEMHSVEADSVALALSDFRVFTDNVRLAIQQQDVDSNTLLENLRAKIDEDNARYFQLRQSEQEVNEALRAQDNIRQQITALERIQHEVETSQEELLRLVTERERLRSFVSKACDTIYELRLNQVNQINEQFNEKVVLSISQGSESSAFQRKLISLLEGSRLRNRDEIVAELASKVRPAELVDVIESGDSSRLSDLLQRDLGQMARLVSFLGDSAQLYDLEAQVFEDELEITLFDGGVPKPVEQLSKGQKATAILPLILRSAEYPLIFDQPEDDLDNRFIFETLVQIIRRLKLERQIIFVTHNANIPVLGDAESIVVMHMETPKKARAPKIGDVESVKPEILSLLEGGAEAFKRRSESYGRLIK